MLGEGAVWDYKAEKLFWVDIEKGKLHIYDPNIEKDTTIDVGQRIGTVVPESNNTVIVALQNGVYRLNLKDEGLDFLVNPEKGDKNNRLNDGKCDPAGRFWVGSMSLDNKPNDAALYRINDELMVEKIIDNVSVSNGICWSSLGNIMYYIDTPTRKIRKYAFDIKHGLVKYNGVAVEVDEKLGYPDGMTIDEDGRLWVAMWDGGAVCCFNPEDGKLIRKIDIPAPRVTSCAFGGKNLEKLYITTATVGLTKEQLEEYPLSGSVFMIEPGVAGIPANYFGEY